MKILIFFVILINFCVCPPPKEKTRSQQLCDQLEKHEREQSELIKNKKDGTTEDESTDSLQNVDSFEVPFDLGKKTQLSNKCLRNIYPQIEDHKSDCFKDVFDVEIPKSLSVFKKLICGDPSKVTDGKLMSHNHCVVERTIDDEVKKHPKTRKEIKTKFWTNVLITCKAY